MLNLTSLTDYGKGRNAYTDGDSHLYLLSSPDFKEGYREAFDENNIQQYDHSGFWSEICWDQHYFGEIESVQAADLSFEPCGSARLGGRR